MDDFVTCSTLGVEQDSRQILFCYRIRVCFDMLRAKTSARMAGQVSCAWAVTGMTFCANAINALFNVSGASSIFLLMNRKLSFSTG
ncbi:MAG: hypothetical protein KDE47_15390 [Caldilineaceae bacterium]|nr:hypothetical protein [Caldilineaceae bacterium]